jgi:hypothetical protein
MIMMCHQKVYLYIYVKIVVLTYFTCKFLFDIMHDLNWNVIKFKCCLFTGTWYMIMYWSVHLFCRTRLMVWHAYILKYSCSWINLISQIYGLYLYNFKISFKLNGDYNFYARGSHHFKRCPHFFTIDSLNIFF